MNTEEKWLKLKKQIEEEKDKKTRLDGQLDAIKKRFEEIDCKTIEDVQEYLTDINKQYQEVSDQIAKEIEQVEDVLRDTE